MILMISIKLIILQVVLITDNDVDDNGVNNNVDDNKSNSNNN